MKNIYKLYFDGAVKPNPGGVASYGFVITLNDDHEVDRGYGILGSGKFMTDVRAECYALSSGLLSFLRHYDTPHASLKVFGDSEFVVAKVKNPASRHDEEFKYIANQLEYVRSLGVEVEILWIPREDNTFCDTLSKKLRALNEAVRSPKASPTAEGFYGNFGTSTRCV